MNRILLIMAIAVLAGCMPAITIPEPYPIKSVNYRFDRGSQEWTKEECTTNSVTQMPMELEMVCYKEKITELPPGVTKTKAL